MPRFFTIWPTVVLPALSASPRMICTPCSLLETPMAWCAPTGSILVTALVLTWLVHEASSWYTRGILCYHHLVSCCPDKNKSMQTIGGLFHSPVPKQHFCAGFFFSRVENATRDPSIVCVLQGPSHCISFLFVAATACWCREFNHTQLVIAGSFSC